MDEYHTKNQTLLSLLLTELFNLSFGSFMVDTLNIQLTLHIEKLRCTCTLSMSHSTGACKHFRLHAPVHVRFFANRDHWPLLYSISLVIIIYINTQQNSMMN